MLWVREAGFNIANPAGPLDPQPGIIYTPTEFHEVALFHEVMKPPS